MPLSVAPPDFEFTLKAWQLITHQVSNLTYRRLKTGLSEKEREQFGHTYFLFNNVSMWDDARRSQETLS